jgi:hypothetical protein
MQFRASRLAVHSVRAENQLSGNRVYRSSLTLQLRNDLLRTMSGNELPRVRTELQNLLVVPSLAPHPVQANPESAGHRYFGNALFPTHGQM